MSPVWTPDATIRAAYWIGGGQWAGKTTVAALLADRHGLIHYHCDYHDARGHEDRRVAARLRRGEPPPDWTAYWTELAPREMAARTLAGFAEQFPWVLDDLRALSSPHPVVADGWSLRPELVAASADPARMVVLAPTAQWQRRQAALLPRAAAFGERFPDPAGARQRRLERDRLVAQDAADRARALGIHVIDVDGARDAESIADEVAGRFGLV